MSEQIKWVCVYKTSNRFEAEAVKGNIESANIPCVLLNKQDSSYLAFGYVELHVPENMVEASNIVLNNQQSDN